MPVSAWSWSSIATAPSLALFALSVAFGFVPSSPPTRHRRVLAPVVSGPLCCSKTPHVPKKDAVELETQTELDVQDVRVYDNVFSPAACEVLRCLAVEGTLRRDSEDTILFLRPPCNTTALTPLEHAVHSTLTAFGDSCKVVEYWYRDEYMNLDAHVDIDEVELDEEGTLRAPHASHVLYLKVKDDLVGMAPTCVFPGQRMGWSSNEEANGTGTSSEVVDMVTVPAVAGRVLRFPGSAMHAVPCPAHRLLMSEEEEEMLIRQEEMQEEEEEEELDDADADDLNEYDIERAVLLFNTWPADGPPPRGVDMDYADEDEAPHTEAERVAEWEADYGIDAALLHCHPKEQWREQKLMKNREVCKSSTEFESDAAAKVIARVNLMGEQERRLTSEETVRLWVDDEGLLRNALNQEEDPTWLCLQQQEQEQ